MVSHDILFETTMKVLQRTLMLAILMWNIIVMGSKRNSDFSSTFIAAVIFCGWVHCSCHNSPVWGIGLGEGTCAQKFCAERSCRPCSPGSETCSSIWVVL